MYIDWARIGIGAWGCTGPLLFVLTARQKPAPDWTHQQWIEHLAVYYLCLFMFAPVGIVCIIGALVG